MSDEPKTPAAPSGGNRAGLYPGGAGRSSAFLPAFTRQRQFASLLPQKAVELLDQLNPGVQIRKTLGVTSVEAYFEEPGFSKATRWALVCLHRNEVSRLHSELKDRYEPLVRSNLMDKLLIATELELEPEDRGALDALYFADHVTISRLTEIVHQRVGNTAQSNDIPTASGFVKIDHNDPSVGETQQALGNLADQIERSNTLPLPNDERAALAEEVRILASMLSERVIRLALVQFAISHDGTLGYIKNRLADHIQAAVVATIVAMLAKHFGLLI